MASTLTSRDRLSQADADSAYPTVGSAWPRLGVRTRQIALITLLVALIVLVLTVINMAQLTAVFLNRTAEEVRQVSRQVSYAIQQELDHNASTNHDADPYAALASDHAGVRGLMESTIVTSRQISYIYLTDEANRIVRGRDGRIELAANRHMIGDERSEPPGLNRLFEQSPYIQLARVMFGGPIYEFRAPLTAERDSNSTFYSLPGYLHIGVSAAAVRRELLSPIVANLVIGLLAVLIATVVAITSANLLIRPLQAISTSIDRLGFGMAGGDGDAVELPRDDVVSGVTSRLRQLGERLAGERSELQLMRGRLRQVISHLEERLVLVNPEGRVILASPDAGNILGAAQVELAGSPITDTLGQGHPLVSLIDRAFVERRSLARTTLYLPDGARPRHLLASVQYIEDSGEPVGALVSLRDYESFQRFESQWDLSKKLADLGRITSGIAHEVKNPLNAMVIHLEILRSKLESGGGDPSAQIEILDSEIKRLDRVVQTFLNFTRPLDIHLEPLDLNLIVSQVVALASTEASERGVTVAAHLAEGPLVVKGDPDLLKQALLNIIINGCQSMPEGGPLKVVSSRPTESLVRVAISDRGIGIAPEARQRIFNLYYTTKKGGTGIGLAQAFRAIQLHNGSIRFESEMGVGTTFEITLPAFS